MKLLNCVLFISVTFQIIHALPAGLVDKEDIVFNAVPANPRFPVVRPEPEATTFIPNIESDDKNEPSSEGSGFEEDTFDDGKPENDTAIEPRHFPINGPCRIRYETIYEVQEVETNEEKCTTVNERACETSFREKCVTVIEKVCQPITRDQCKTEFKQECQQLFREEKQSYVEDKCETTTVRKCEKYWKVVDDNRKVWVEDPNRCQDAFETKCNPITKEKVNQIPYQECIQVPFETCIQVEETVCNDFPREKCNPEPFEECRNVPRQRCITEHRLIPKQVARQIQVRVCDNIERDVIDNDYVDDEIVPTRRPIIDPTEQPPVRIFDSNLGEQNLTQVFSAGKCLSWNGKACSGADTVNVGRGPGSCNSDNDCPCCAPFCSKHGYCQNNRPQLSSEVCPVPPLGKSCSGNVKSTCWSPGVNDVDCPGHGLCCFDGCANTCRNEKATQNPGFFEDNVIPLIENENEIGSCSCNEFVSSKGYGRCEKDFQDGPICYVNQPSICKDATNSQSHPGQYFSWEACKKQHLPDQTKNQPPLLRQTDGEHLHQLDDDVIDIQLNTSPCACIDFVNKNGIGNCQMGEKRFYNENVCYVSLPSSCPDLKNSSTDAGKFLSAIACQKK